MVVDDEDACRHGVLPLRCRGTVSSTSVPSPRRSADDHGAAGAFDPAANRFGHAVAVGVDCVRLVAHAAIAHEQLDLLRVGFEEHVDLVDLRVARRVHHRFATGGHERAGGVVERRVTDDTTSTRT